MIQCYKNTGEKKGGMQILWKAQDQSENTNTNSNCCLSAKDTESSCDHLH